MVHSDAAQQFKERLRKTPGLSCETVEKGDQVLSDYFDEQCSVGDQSRPARTRSVAWRPRRAGQRGAFPRWTRRGTVR